MIHPWVHLAYSKQGRVQEGAEFHIGQVPGIARTRGHTSQRTAGKASDLPESSRKWIQSYANCINADSPY